MSTNIPKKTTAEDERSKLVEFQRQTLCDVVIERAVGLMIDSGASAELICERLLTHMTVRAAAITPPPRLAHAFRQHVADIERGVFHKLDGKAGRRH